ncbi:glycerophosphodiester phosphodiesterase [Advenella mimigardefordensis]|uniref:Glycerophosphoryl diester phosphodiesterase n=1 Tax=Advenella mimigardefordensis (strain DSM 17166 / LMG 22922 / DPN7) TaxID=1247726 RepID=W0PEL6_ADVMD|nr:glycerophosphodiester phosphodiesterase [Advenella mimigardefordensis]AHG63962.1 glycerophosphoryl diester phosphodiesterase [Advenella mimigardefordensis DPN7]
MSSKSPVSWPYPAVIAHRGGGRIAPENTLAGLRCGYDHGFLMSEFDVKLSGDNVLVVLHDDTVDRTSDGSGAAAGMTFTELAQLDMGGWHSAWYAGESLPTFSQFARFILENGLLCNIEIKPCPGREAQTGAAVAQAVKQLWAKGGVAPLVSSFSQEALAAFAQQAPDVPRAFLIDSLPEDFEAILVSLGCQAINLNQKYLDESSIARIHAAGYKVCAYTVNDYRRARQLLGWGCDAIFTDELIRIPADLGVY